MIKVSDAWKAAHKQMLLPESFVEISMNVGDAAVSGSVSSTNTASFANSSDIINAERKTAGELYTLLEQNRWLLDGSQEIAPNTSSLSTNTRYVSSNGSASTVTINLSSTGSSIPGVTITWSREYNEYATAFTVTAKNGSTVLGSVTVTNNKSVVSTLDMPISGYRTLVITISEWSIPDHRHRIDSVKFGQMLVFDKNQIISYTHEMSGNPLGTELSRNAIEFEVDNSDGRWNMLNPSGLAKYLYERQRLVVHYGLQLDSGIEWVQAGVFYLSEWKAPANGMTATFIARDAIEFMLNTTYSRTSCEAKTGVILYDYVGFYRTKDEVFSWDEDEKLLVWGEKPIYEVTRNTSVSIYEISLETYGPHEKTLCRTEYGWTDFSEIRCLSNMELWSDVANAVTASSLRNGTKLCFGNKLKTVRGPVLIPETPISQFLQQCAAASGYTIWQTADGEIHMHTPTFVLGDYAIAKSISYSHPEMELAKPLKTLRFSRYNVCGDSSDFEEYSVNSSGEDVSVDCPYLWDDSTHRSLADKYINWWNSREIVSGEFRADPRLELFDVVVVESKYGEITPVAITDLKYSYTGSFQATYTGKKIPTAMLGTTHDAGIYWEIGGGIIEDEIIEEEVEEV